LCNCHCFVTDAAIQAGAPAELHTAALLARDFTPLTQAQMASLNELGAPVAKQSLFFRFTDRSKG